MSILAYTNGMSRSDWLQARMAGIGGSDVAGVLGMSQWTTPLSVYRDKTGQGDAVEENEAMYWGTVLEEIVASEFAKRTGLKIRRRNAIFQDDEHPCLLANIDRDIVGQSAILECKTTGAFNTSDWGEDGTDEVPFPYILQCQHYLRVTGCDLAHLAVLIGGRDFRMYAILRNEDLIASMVAKCVAFWTDNVIAQIPPPPINSADIEAMYRDGGHEGRVIANDETIALAIELAGIKETEKEIQGRKEEVESRIKLAIGDAQELIRAHDNKTLVSWKSTTSKLFDTKAFKEAHTDLYMEYAKESSSRRLLLKTAAFGKDSEE